MDVITELQHQRESLKQNIHDMDESIKKLTGRDPADTRRLPASKRVQLKRNSFGSPGDNQPPKRASTEKRRWGNTALTRPNNLDSGGEEQEEKKPAVQSSVVVTGKPIESPRAVPEDNATKKRNKRMFGLLMGTLKQFKRESQVKSEQEAKREEKLIKVEEQVQKDKEDAVVERRELFQTRRGKQQELRDIEFKIEMAELNEELKTYYGQIKDCIQVKSTPRIFYKPALHNEKTTKLLKDSQDGFKESLHQRMREIAMCTEDDLIPTGRVFRRYRHVTSGKSAKDPIIIDQAPSKRNLFEEDADLDQQDGVEVIVEDPVETVLVTDENIAEDIPIEDNLLNDEAAGESNSLDILENIQDIGVDVDVGDTNEQGQVSPGLEPSMVDVDEPVNVIANDVSESSQVVEEGSEVHVRDRIDTDETAESTIVEDVKGCGESELVDEVGVIDDIIKDDTGDDIIKDPGTGDDIHTVDEKQCNSDELVQNNTDDITEQGLEQVVPEQVQGDSEISKSTHEQDILDAEEHSNIFEQLQESNIDNKNVFKETNDNMTSKIDDSDTFLHDEYADQLLEQVVDEGRAVLRDSYSVVDERVSNLNNKTQIPPDTTENIVGGSDSNIHSVVEGINYSEDHLPEGNEFSLTEDP